jgi:hypothetical protein
LSSDRRPSHAFTDRVTIDYFSIGGIHHHHLGFFAATNEQAVRLGIVGETSRRLSHANGETVLDLDDSSDRQALKAYLLNALRPQALKILEEIAKKNHDTFDRPLTRLTLRRAR